MPFFFCKISPLHQLLLRAGGSLTQIAAHWKQRTVFSPPTTLRPHILLHHSHTDDSEFSSRTWRVGCMVEVDTNFKLFLCVTLLVFPISALFRFTSLCVHIDGRRHVMNSFRNSRLLKWFSAADCAESAFNDKHFAYNRISWPSTAVQGYFGPLPKYMPSTSMAAVAGEYFCFRFSVCFCLTNEPNRSCDQLKTS